MSSDDIQQSIEKIPPAALRLHTHWLRHRSPIGEIQSLSSTPYVATPKVGRNDPCPCGSGKKFKQLLFVSLIAPSPKLNIKSSFT
ncbi:SEC-C metal-binding domain-containing protein [Serratia sp. UGAL515B_01]|uniref:SEC-C metal-binding domain-containing protein n=1 Tax=Serratia sp. UGAL515B_01 TaxID=2986763 RepID=UPI003985B26F